VGGHFPLLMDAGLADLIACVAAFGRSLQEKFDPQRFLAQFSSRARRQVHGIHHATV